MNKKIIVAAVIYFTGIASNVYAQRMFDPYGGRTSQIKLYTGIAFALAGAILAASGFKKIDTSKPILDTSSWSWSKSCAGGTYWNVYASGEVENTGNVALKNVKIQRTYLNYKGEQIGSDTCSLDDCMDIPLETSSVDAWNNTARNLTDEPVRVGVSASYDYSKLYGRTDNSQGIIGLTLTACGLCLLIDWAVDYGLFSKLEEKGIQIKTTQKPDRFDLTLAKKI